MMRKNLRSGTPNFRNGSYCILLARIPSPFIIAIFAEHTSANGSKHLACDQALFKTLAKLKFACSWLEEALTR
jgi:hypothetical protein